VHESSLINDIKNCQLCAKYLPQEPRPVLQFNPNAKILIAGQAPGRKVHETGVPFNDPSGDRLRAWMGIDRDTFYNPELIAIVPMGFCFPGTGKSGDLPPRPECSQTWHPKLLSLLRNLQLTLVIGQYAIGYHLDKSYKSVTEAVHNGQRTWPEKLPLPHPSPRNNLWLKRNAWFERDVIPKLQSRVRKILEG